MDEQNEQAKTDMSDYQDLSVTIGETQISVSFSGPITLRAVYLAHQMIDLIGPEEKIVDPIFTEWLRKGP